MAATVIGLRDSGASRDVDGYREYWADWLVECDGETDGPQAALFASGLPGAGSAYVLPEPCEDYDPWAFCTPERECKKHPNYSEDDGAPDYYIVSSHYTTKPMKRCNSTEIEDPLNEPPRISGGFDKILKQRLTDRNGVPLLYLSYERIKGPVVERRTGLPTVTVEVNLPTLPIGAMVPTVECLNDATFWGYAARWVRLADIVWSRKLYGVCFFYYTATYTFEFKQGGYDIPILNEGMKQLKDGVDIEDAKPTDFEFILGGGEPIGPLPIRADGKPAQNEGEYLWLDKEIDFQTNFALLPGVPSSI